MAITLRTHPEDKLIELGGGANPQIRPNVDVRACYDKDGNQTVDFQANFEEPLPIQSEEWDGVFSQFLLEHLSFRKIRNFLKEVFRILKPNGKAIFVVPNTEEQIKFIQNNPQGWDDRDDFDSFSGVLFGDQTFDHNYHQCYLSPVIATRLFREAGFDRVIVQPFGERKTDMVIEAFKDQKQVEEQAPTVSIPAPQPTPPSEPPQMQSEVPPVHYLSGDDRQITSNIPREELFGKDYFNGGKKWGGYANEGYRDFPVHQITAKHILARKPESVLEVGCARGYVLKRVQDQGIPGYGIEISRHCYMTRVCDGITLQDICTFPWRLQGYETDLCYSIATLEHIPGWALPEVIKQMAKHCKRGLHGIDFGEKDDGFDKTHCTLRPRQWWIDRFAEHAPGWPVEIVNKEELEKGSLPPEVLIDDKLIKLNIGSFLTMAHHNWINIDIHDLMGYAQHEGYRFQQLDVKQGLTPYGTGTVDAIVACHFLEHLNYQDGVAFLQECRRVIKPTGGLRIIVPDAGLLTSKLYDGSSGLGEYDEINEECSNVSTEIAKLWSLLFSGHQAAYDLTTLMTVLTKAGFKPVPSHFRSSLEMAGNNETIFEMIQKQTLDMLPCISLYMNAIPLQG